MKPISATMIPPRTTHCDQCQSSRRHCRADDGEHDRDDLVDLQADRAGSAAEELLRPPPARSRPVRPSRAEPSLVSVAQPCPLCDSRSPTTAPASRAGRRSQGCERCRPSSRPRWSGSSDLPRPSPSRAGPTPGSTPGPRWRASRRRRAAGGARAGAQLAHRPRRRRCCPPSRPVASTRAAMPAREPTATGCWRSARPIPSRPGSRCSGRIGSTEAPRSAARRPCRAPMTSRRSRPPRPSTSASSGTSCGPSGTRRPAVLGVGAGCSSSGSRPTPSCATWCGCWSGTMLEVGGGRRALEDFRALLEGAPRERAGDTARGPRPAPRRGALRRN